MVAFHTDRMDHSGVVGMTGDERLSEVSGILATGLLRLRFRTRVAGGSFLGESTFGLEVGRPGCPHVADLQQKGDAT